MYLAGSIGVAVEEMWRLAVAMASLKYIAQVVRQEVQRDIIDTDSEILSEDDYEDISLGNGLDANEDITEGLDANKDIIKGLDAKKDITKGHDANEDITNKEQDMQSLISMKSHVLDCAETPITPVQAQFSISMISHCQPCKDEDQDSQHESDPHLMTSMVAHCLYGKDIFPELSLSMNMKNLHLLNKITATNEEDKFFISSVAHQLPMIDCPIESSDYKISMVSHEVMENNKNEDDNIIETDSVSMLAHQICNEAALQPEDIETPNTLEMVRNNTIVSKKHDSEKKISTSGLAYKPNIENILNAQVLCDEQITDYVQTDLENMQENVVEDETSNLSAALREEGDASRMCDLSLSKQWLLKPKFGSYTNFLDAARISHRNTLDRVYQMRIRRIQGIQENVEDEIDEYKRRKNMLANDKKGSIKEYKLLTYVKGVEFELHILIHQLDAQNEDIESSVLNSLTASEYRHEDKKQLCDESQNKLKKTRKHDQNIKPNEHGNRLDKTQVLHEIDVSKDSLKDYKEHILKVKTCAFAPGNDINLAIEQLLQLASTMENTLKYIVGMIYTDYEQEKTNDVSEQEHSSNLTSDPSDINQIEDNIIDGDKSSNKHVKQTDMVSIMVRKEEQTPEEDALKPSTKTENILFESQPEGWCSEKCSSLSVNAQDYNCKDKEIADKNNHSEPEDELVTVVVAGDVTDLEPIKTTSDASLHNSRHCYGEADQIFITSFVGHQVIAIDLPDEFVQMPVTLASHMIANITEEEEERRSEMDSGMTTSMVAHQMVVKDNIKNLSDEDLLNSNKDIDDFNRTKKMNAETAFVRQLERHYLRKQEKIQGLFSTSMVSHQLPYLDTSLSRFSVSATAHRVLSCAEENSESLSSMVSYQIKTNNAHINTKEEETKKFQLNNKVSHPDFYSSLASHRLPVHEGIEYPEFISSMAAHQDITMGKDVENTNAKVSMHTHALVQANTITDTGLDNSDQTKHANKKGEGERRPELKIESSNTDQNETLMNKTMQAEKMNKVHLPDSTDRSKKEIDDNSLIKVIKTNKTKEKSITKLKIQARGTIESKSGNKNEQTYKVRFRVKLTGQDGSSSKSSVLQYLRGCLTGQSLFQAKQ